MSCNSIVDKIQQCNMKVTSCRHLDIQFALLEGRKFHADKDSKTETNKKAVTNHIQANWLELNYRQTRRWVGKPDI